jgi:hypothetical protein
MYTVHDIKMSTVLVTNFRVKSFVLHFGGGYLARPEAGVALLQQGLKRPVVVEQHLQALAAVHVLLNGITNRNAIPRPCYYTRYELQ